MKMRITRSIVPNLFTLMNIFMGFTAIVHISNGEIERGAIFILVAAVFDALDGVVARILKAASELGAELDSLCDAVSFGVAPSFMLYMAFFHQYDNLGILVASLPALAGVVRLARFNTELISLDDKLYFKGLPIPSAALTLITYVIFIQGKGYLTADQQTAAIFIVTIGVSLVMISTVKFDNMPRPTKKSFKKRPVIFIIFFAGLILAVVSKGKLIFPMMIFYILTSSLRHFIFWLKATREAPDDIDDSDENQQSYFDV